MNATIRYTLDGSKVRVIGNIDGLHVGYVQVEAAYGDEAYETDGPVEIFSDDQLFETPPTTVLDERVAKLQQTIKTMEETISRLRIELAKQTRERENYKRWLQQNRAWLDVEGVTTGKITHRAEFSQWGRWNITDLRPKHGYTMDSIILYAKRQDDSWEWYWTAPKSRDWREKTQLFESEDAAKAWIEERLTTLDLKNIDLRMGREIIEKAKNDGIRCPFHIIEFVEAEAQKKRDADLELLRAQMEAIEKGSAT